MTLTGSVTDLASNAGLSGAAVLILDGANAGRIVSTDRGGDYRFDGLQSGSVNLSANAVGYLESRASVLINGMNVLNFAMFPVSGVKPR